MENLLNYLYNKFVDSDNHHSAILCKEQGLMISSIKEDEFLRYLPLISKNIIVYSNAGMQLKLSIPNLLVFQRLHKIQKIAESLELSNFYEIWIKNQMFPFVVNNKKKFQNSPFIYVDKSNDQDKEQKNLYMLNIPEITKRLMKQKLKQLYGGQQLKMETETDFINAIQKAKWFKFQENISQRLGTDALMILNFIVKFPFLDEKQLLKKTMLKLVDLRKCINILVTEGIIQFYQQNSRTTLFKAINRESLLNNFRNNIAESILNLYIRLDSEPNIEKQTKLLITISNLDDILLLF